ncbi:DNA methylase N-4 [bacterium]|nr:DNA methylase N-4 [bacterium]
MSLQRPELEIEYVSVRALRSNPRNARRHPQKQIEFLKSSIMEHGFVQPVLIDENNRLIAGHGRLEAAKQLGRSKVPAIRLKHLSSASLRALALADNRIAELASWDEDVLAIEFKELLEEDLEFSLADVTGFESPVIDRLVYGDDFAGSDPADDALPQVRDGPAITRPGDLYLIGEHRLLCGDARDILGLRTLMSGERARQVIADPPYNVPVDGHVSGKGKVRHREFEMAAGEMSTEQFTSFNCDWLSAASGVCEDGALLYAFMDGKHFAELVDGGREAGLELITACVWAKSNAGMGGFYRSQVELVAVFKSGKGAHVNNIALGRHGRNRTTLWSYPGYNSFGANRDAALKQHPTVKPVGLLADAILDASARGEIVLDPFLGSGSTIIAAHRTGRRGYGIELDSLYVDAALDRFAAVLEIDPVRASDGARWSALRAEHEEAAP